MFGRKKRDRWEEDGFPEEESLTDGTGIYSGITDDDADPGNPYPDEEIYGDDGYGPEYGTDDPAGEPWADGEDEEEPEEKPETRSIFRPDVRKPNFVISVLVNTVRVLLLVGVLAGLAVLGTLAGIAKGYVDTAPELDLVALDTPDQNTEFMDRNRNLLTVYRGTENRIAVPLASIPQRMRNAFIAVEDARFYSHGGVDLKRIVGAFVANLTTSGTQGGSTITQQLIKNTLLSPEQSYKRKIQEAYLALQLEMKYSKDQILETYLKDRKSVV